MTRCDESSKWRSQTRDLRIPGAPVLPIERWRCHARSASHRHVACLKALDDAATGLAGSAEDEDWLM